jgi:hypothetical protein
MEPLIIAAIVAFFGSVLVAYLNQREARRQTREDNFFRALEWLTGGTQKRNVGIAAVEFFWKDKKRLFLRNHKGQVERFRSLGIDALSNSAMYLLLQSEQGIAVHEANNLSRIMQFLLSVPQEEAKKHALQYEDLKSALDIAYKRRKREGEEQNNSVPEPPREPEEDIIWAAPETKKWTKGEGIWVDPNCLTSWRNRTGEKMWA